MKNSVRRNLLLVTHGVAILAGSLVGTLLFRDSTIAVATDPSEAKPVKSSAPDLSSAWLDQSLRKIREEESKSETPNQAPPTMAEFLKKCREDAAAEQKEYAERLDEVVKKSAKYANEPDPLAAIRRNMRAGNWEDDHSLEILQAWLDKDPEAALEEIRRNWRLSEEEMIPLMLERKFGREWLKKQVEDALTPVRLSASLTGCLGRGLAWDGSLEGLVDQYRSITDPTMKLNLVNWFAWSWPLDDPLTTARFLAKDIPIEMREELMGYWTPPAELQLGAPLFSCGVGMSPTYANREWFNQVHAALNPGSPDKPAPSIPKETAVPMKSFTEEVSARVESGDAREKAAADVLIQKIHDAIIEGTDLEELYGEGKINRDEFLAELMRRIPDAKAFPEAFEKEAWRATSMTSDARQSAIWAAELSKRGAGESLVPNGVSSGNIYGDPRIPLRLNRYQLFCDSIPDSPNVSMIRDRQSYEWSRWHVVAPAQANAWRDALPPESPLREVIRAREHDDQKRRESQ